MATVTAPMKWTVISFDVDVEQLSIADPANADELDKFQQWQAGRKGGTGQDRTEFAVDVPAALAPDGTPLVRGTAVAGPLRAWLAQYQIPGHAVQVQQPSARQVVGAGGRLLSLAEILMGSSNEVADRRGVDVVLAPSALHVVAVHAAGTVDPGRVRVAINRQRGAAEPGKLFRRGRVTGARVAVTLAVDHAELAATVRERGLAQTPSDLLSALVAALEHWPVQIGGLRSCGTGVGSFVTGNTQAGDASVLNIGTLDLGQRADLEALFTSTSTLDYLHTRTAPLGSGATNPSWAVAPGGTRDLVCEFRLVDALLIDAHTERPDTHPARGNHASTAGTVPATAWRGVLRSRCEFILTSLGFRPCDSGVATCGRCPTCALFGWSPPAGLRAMPTSEAGAASLLRFHDSPVRAKDGGSPIRATIPHVAIDRFSGGASDAKLYTHEVILGPALLTLRIDTATPRRRVPGWAWPLLWLAIADIDAGLVGVGSSTTRGYGTLKVAKPGATWRGTLTAWPAALAELRGEYDSRDH